MPISVSLVDRRTYPLHGRSGAVASGLHRCGGTRQLQPREELHIGPRIVANLDFPVHRSESHCQESHVRGWVIGSGRAEACRSADWRRPANEPAGTWGGDERRGALGRCGGLTPHLTLPGVHDAVWALGVRRPGDGHARVVVGQRLFLSPPLARVDEEADLVTIPPLRHRPAQPPSGPPRSLASRLLACSARATARIARASSRSARRASRSLFDRRPARRLARSARRTCRSARSIASR